MDSHPSLLQLEFTFAEGEPKHHLCAQKGWFIRIWKEESAFVFSGLANTWLLLNIYGAFTVFQTMCKYFHICQCGTVNIILILMSCITTRQFSPRRGVYICEFIHSVEERKNLTRVIDMSNRSVCTQYYKELDNPNENCFPWQLQFLTYSTL